MQTFAEMETRLSAYGSSDAAVLLARYAIQEARRTGSPEQAAEARAAFAEIELEIAAEERLRALPAEAAEAEAEAKREAFSAELARRGSMSGAEVRAWEQGYAAAQAYDEQLRRLALRQPPAARVPVAIIRGRLAQLGACARSQTGGDADADADADTRQAQQQDERPTGESEGL